MCAHFVFCRSYWHQFGWAVMSFLLLLPLCASPTLHLADTRFSYPVCIGRSAVMQDLRTLTTWSLSFPKSFVFSYMLGLSGIVLVFLNCANVLKKGIHFFCAHVKCAKLQSGQPSVPYVLSEWPWCWPQYMVPPFLWASVCGFICVLTHLLFMIKLLTETRFTWHRAKVRLTSIFKRIAGWPTAVIHVDFLCSCVHLQVKSVKLFLFACHDGLPVEK